VIVLNWREISIKADRDAVDTISDILVECGAGGVVVEDPYLINERIADNLWDAYEFPDELLSREFVLVRAYLPCDSKLDDSVHRLCRRLDSLDGECIPIPIKDISFADVREEDWANSWKAYYKPVRISDRIVIKPTWEDYSPQPGELVIELDPGMAFGIGTHPTTVMCIKLLEKIIRGGETVFDIGTGSGILAIVSAKLGAGEVKAVDVDEVAVKAAKANASLNLVDDTVEITAGNLLDNVKGQADIVVSNIVADVIISICSDAARAVRKGGRFVASGIIAGRAEEVIEHIRQAGFKIEETVREGDWVSLAAVME